MKDGEAPYVLHDACLSLAKHNLEVTLRRTKEECFRVAKIAAAESLEEAMKFDGFVRRQYADEPRKMAEWEEIMSRYEFADEEVTDEGQ